MPTGGYGLGPFGLGTPTTIAAPPDGDAGCRYINPASRDYEIDAVSGQLAQMPAIRQRVLLAVMTLRGSSNADPAMGVKAPRKMGTSFEAEMRAAVRSALRTMTDIEKVMRIDDIIVKRGAGGRSLTTIVFTDLTTGEEDQASF